MGGDGAAGAYGGRVTRTAADLLARIVADMGGTARPNQEQMAGKVEQTIDSGGVLLVQAGTGTGKSLAYLAPAVVAARDNGVRTVIATATLALQRQLITRDVPAALAAVPDADVAAALLKGRGNYLCRARLEGVAAEQEGLDLELAGGRLEQQAARLRRWAQRTDSGDRDDCPDQVDPRVWRALSATGRECVGSARCRFADECFSEQARRRAAAADIVVTNHALLALDALDDAPLLPEYDVLIIDEAHEFAARATSTGTEQLGAAAVERAATAARPLIDADRVERLTEAGNGLVAALAGMPGERRRVADPPPPLVTALAVVRDACHLAASALPSGEAEDPHRRHRAAAALSEVHDVAGRLLAASDRDVLWFGGAADPTLYVAPLSVAGLVSEYLLHRQATILTSATLTVGGDFEAVAGELGLGTGADSVDVGSPFDYPRQGILYTAADLPPPGRDGPGDSLVQRIRDLVEAAGGRSLILLSSWRAVERVAEGLSEQTPAGAALLVQRRGEPVGPLVAAFANDETSILVGTMSLFQGVDVPGRSCTCVIIDRIPFPRPDDPVLQARSEQVERSGGNGFMSVSVPRAALLLAQGAGRLIRSREDRGVVAVLDARLARARYSGYLRDSLPPFWRTTDTAAVLEALRRLAEQQ
jgi:ATP-dependent DNA helicase DinG